MIAAGTGGEVVGIVLDSTGVGAIAGIPIGVVSTGLIAVGATVAGHGVFTAVNTGNNIYNQATDNSGGNSGGRSAKDYPETKDRNRTYEGAEAQLKGMEKAVEKDKKIPKEIRKNGYVKRPDRSKQRFENHLKNARGKSTTEFLDEIDQ